MHEQYSEYVCIFIRLNYVFSRISCFDLSLGVDATDKPKLLAIGFINLIKRTKKEGTRSPGCPGFPGIFLFSEVWCEDAWLT